MKYPSLVRKYQCKTPISIRLELEEIDEDGAPVSAYVGEFLCNYQDSAKRVFQENKTWVQLSGVALLDGDIAPSMSAIAAGSAVVFGEQRKIYRGQKCRNPDGSVNYTRLELI